MLQEVMDCIKELYMIVIKLFHYNQKQFPIPFI